MEPVLGPRDTERQSRPGVIISAFLALAAGDGFGTCRGSRRFEAVASGCR